MATPAVDRLAERGVAFRLHRYEVVPRPASYGEHVAAALGVEPDRVFKTLVCALDEGLAVAVVPVLATVELKALAAALGAKQAALAARADAERAAGSVVGAISPLSLRRPLDAVVDESATAATTVFVSAGRRGLEIELAPEDLVAVAGARVARIARFRDGRPWSGPTRPPAR